MSTSKTRPQYVFIEVKKSRAPACVTLSGPTDVLSGIMISCSSGEVNIGRSCAGSAMEIRLTWWVQGADNLMLLKAALLEEALKRGFIPASNVSDDFLVLSREVIVEPRSI